MHNTRPVYEFKPSATRISFDYPVSSNTCQHSVELVFFVNKCFDILRAESQAYRISFLVILSATHSARVLFCTRLI